MSSEKDEQTSNINLANLGGVSGLSSLTLGGATVIILLNQMGTLTQHGEELNHIRSTQLSNLEQRNKRTSEVNLEIIKLSSRLDLCERRSDDLNRLMNDPKARPDSWSRSDDENARQLDREYIKSWILSQFGPANGRVKNDGLFASPKP